MFKMNNTEKQKFKNHHQQQKGGASVSDRPTSVATHVSDPEGEDKEDRKKHLNQVRAERCPVSTQTMNSQITTLDEAQAPEIMKKTKSKHVIIKLLKASEKDTC